MPFGGLAVNLCGDFLQLPPVNKDGSKPSLAKPPRTSTDVGAGNENDGGEIGEHDAMGEGGRAECRQGFELWRSVQRAVCLTVNVRAPDILSRLLAEMRKGRMTVAQLPLLSPQPLTEHTNTYVSRELYSPYSTLDTYFEYLKSSALNQNKVLRLRTGKL